MLARLRRRLGPGLSPTSFDLLIVAVAFVVTRMLVLGAMEAAPARHDVSLWGAQQMGAFAGPGPPRLLIPFAHYDAYRYVGLARLGYAPNGTPATQSTAFFPLYPWLVRGADAIVGETFTAAMVVSNLLALAAAFAMYGMGRGARGRRAGRAAAMLLLTSPAGHFLSLGYNESLFCLLVALGLWAVDSDRPWLAALAGALASATRVTGLVVAVALGLKILSRRNRLAWASTAALSCSGIAAYALFCNARYGDPLLFVHVQSLWGRQASLLGPVRAFLAFSWDADYYVVSLAALALAVWMVRRRVTITWTAPAWMLLLLPLSTGTLKSMIRFQGTNVPLLGGAATLLRPRALSWILGAGLVMQIYEAVRFAMVYPNY